MSASPQAARAASVPSLLGYSVQLKKGVRGWKWELRMGGRTPYGTPLAKGEASDQAACLAAAAKAFEGVPS